MNLIIIIIIILILILFTGVLLIFCNRKDLEYNYTKFIGGNSEELNKDIQENDSKSVVNNNPVKKKVSIETSASFLNL